jgi:hypothetical protein
VHAQNLDPDSPQCYHPTSLHLFYKIIENVSEQKHHGLQSPWRKCRELGPREQACWGKALVVKAPGVKSKGGSRHLGITWGCPQGTKFLEESRLHGWPSSSGTIPVFLKPGWLNLRWWYPREGWGEGGYPWGFFKGVEPPWGGLAPCVAQHMVGRTSCLTCHGGNPGGRARQWILKAQVD